MIEVFVSISRFMSFVVIFLHVIRTIKNISILKGDVKSRINQHFTKYFQDVSIIIFLPVYTYLAFFSSGNFAPLFEKLIGLPLALYIGAPLVNEVFFCKGQQNTRKAQTKSLSTQEVTH